MTVIDRHTGLLVPASVVPASVVPSIASKAHEPSRASILKRGVDIAGASIGLLLLAPLLLLVGLVILCSGSGPVLYRQTRVGRLGKTFDIVKFRTMHADADARLAALKAARIVTGPMFKMVDDPRITRVGGILRTFSVDELPQLWNVLRGEMSLVGPRPALPCEVEAYCEQALRRLEVTPGMTGAWQVGGRSTLEWSDGIALDVHYVDNWSHAYDAVILLKTVRAVVRPVGAY